MNPAVKNENGPLARDPLSTQKANVEHLNSITSRKLVGNPAYSFCKSDITLSIPSEEVKGFGSEGSYPTRYSPASRDDRRGESNEISI